MIYVCVEILTLNYSRMRKEKKLQLKKQVIHQLTISEQLNFRGGNGQDTTSPEKTMIPPDDEGELKDKD